MLVLQKGLILPVPMYGGSYFFIQPESEKTKNYSELYTAVNSLKEELRLPVILYYIEDFSVKEIAQILEISEGAVQKRLARARGKLRQELQEVSI